MTPTETFLSTLFAGLTGTLELRPVPAIPSLRDFLCIEDGFYDESRVESYVDRTTAQGVNAFFGVATRVVGARSGRAEDCLELPAVFVDCDWKNSSESRVLEAIAEFPLAPSIVVSSGGGTHAYWLLHEPLDLHGAGNLAATDILRRLAAALEVADIGVSEPVRVLRLPGTLNVKAQYGSPRPVTLDICDPERRYDLSEICMHIPDTDPAIPWRQNSGASLRPGDAQVGGGVFRLQEVIAAGDRHATMFALIRSLQTRGLSFDAAYAACEVENRDRSECPITDAELQSYLRRAWGTPNRSTT